MKFTLQITILVALLLLLSSCFEVTEEVNMNEDGSGKVKVTINLSESQRSLVNYMKMDEVEGMRVPSRTELDRELDLFHRTLQGIEGMSEVKVNRDFDRFIFSFSGDFTNVKVLNQAINELAEVFNRSNYQTLKKDNFHYVGNQFDRYFKYPIQADIYDEASLTMRYLMDTARLISVFRFPKPIQEISNKNAMLSPSKKSVMLQASIAELAKGEVLLDNKISF